MDYGNHSLLCDVCGRMSNTKDFVNRHLCVRPAHRGYPGDIRTPAQRSMLLHRRMNRQKKERDNKLGNSSDEFKNKHQYGFAKPKNGSEQRSRMCGNGTRFSFARKNKVSSTQVQKEEAEEEPVVDLDDEMRDEADSGAAADVFTDSITKEVTVKIAKIAISE